MVEQVLSWMHQRNGLRYASLRYFNAAGGRPKKSAVNLATESDFPFVKWCGWPAR